MGIKPLKIDILPNAPSIKKLIGPSFILLGLGLGSGEIILWPYLTSHYGMGIIWGAIIGITFQFFMNMEIERYALINGESVFVGLSRRIRGISFWFLLSSFVPWIWPGIIASSAKIFGAVFGLEDTKLLGIFLLLTIGVLLTLGPILYRTVETFQKILIGIAVPTICVLSVILAKQFHWHALAKGVVGVGESYSFLPEGIVLASFLAAFAYSGAGGNLNLAQSFYIKEKGFGMGKYAGRITSLLTGKKEDVSLTGTTFQVNQQSVKTFNVWWRNINVEHFIVFWLTGSITILLLAILSFATTYGTSAGITQDISFVMYEAKVIGERIFPFAGVFFLLIAGSTLYGTQLTVFDATSRILVENLLLSVPKKLSEKHIPRLYYMVLWIQILAGVGVFLFGFSEPLQLLVLAAVLNAFAMFVHVGLTLFLNLTSLRVELRPNIYRISIMVLAFLVYGGFSIYILVDRLSKFL